MTKRQQLALETKHKIIVAARQLIADKGINNISVSDITQKAGVAKGSFYTYYTKKEDVLGEIAYQNFGALKEKYIKNATSDTVTEYLRQFIAAIYEGGLELCKSWTANEIQGENCSICKFDFDCANLAEILQAVGIKESTAKAKDVLAFVYGMMTAWCMTDGRYDFAGDFEKNLDVVNVILKR